MSPGDKLALIVFGLTMGAQVIRRSFSARAVKYIFIASGVFVFAALSYLTYRQYLAWEENPLMKYSLPPYRGWDYFFSYVGYRLFAPWLISLLAAIVLARFAEYLNHRFDERFFEREETWLMMLGIFLAGYPGFLFYIILILLAATVVSFFYSLFLHRRLPLYYFWMPMAIAAVFLRIWLVPVPVSNVFVL